MHDRVCTVAMDRDLHLLRHVRRHGLVAVEQALDKREDEIPLDGQSEIAIAASDRPRDGRRAALTMLPERVARVVHRLVAICLFGWSEWRARKHLELRLRAISPGAV